MIDYLKAKGKEVLEYVKPWKLIPALQKAVEKAKANEDAGFFKKIEIFWKSFKNEMKGIKEDEEQVTEDTTGAVKQSVDEVMGDAKETLGLKGEVATEDKEFYDETLAVGVASLAEVDERSGGKASSAQTKIDQAARKGKAEKLEIEESMSVAAVGIMTLRKLRRKFPKKADFRKALERIAKLSKNSKYPLNKLLTQNVLEIFKLKDESAGLTFLSRFGIKADLKDKAAGAVSFVGAEIEGGEATRAGELLKSLSHSPIKNLDELTAFMKKHFFPHTSRGNVKLAVKSINTLITKRKTKMTPKALTDLAFYIDDADYKHLVDALAGQKGTAVAKAA